MECDYEAPYNTPSGNEDSAGLYDSDYEYETTVESTITVYEYSEAITFSDARGSFPYVGVKATYPTGPYRVRIPMFAKGLPFDNGRLEKVLRLERGQTDHPDIVAVYSGSGQAMYLKHSFTDDQFEADEYNGESSLLGEVTEILWDAEDPETTHPLNDIEFSDRDFDTDQEE